MTFRSELFDRRQFLKSAAAVSLAVGDAWAQESFLTPAEFGPMPVPAPDWLRDAVIAEIPARGFNVSDYKNPAKWKSGFGDTTYKSISDKLSYLRDMGFNVLCLYSIYHCTPQTNLFALSYTDSNPDMGTLDDARALIHQAHVRGMYVISNTNHYGVDKTSPLLQEHPDWFLPESNLLYSQRLFDLSNAKARSYIIATHVSWCTDVGLDGWRIDSAGHIFKRSLWSEILQLCEKKGKRILIATENKPLPGYIQGAGMHGFPPIVDMEKSLGHSATKADPYRIGEVSGHNVGEPGDPHPCCAFNSQTGGACGREGCFKVRGSQFVYGYNSLFAPAVPWMLAGETFNATDLALPRSLGNPKMLHSWLDWTDIESQKAVVDDFRRIGRVREQHRDLFHNNLYETKLIDVPCTSQPGSRVKPYVRFLPETKAAIVVGNDSTTEAVTFQLRIPLAALGMNAAEQWYLKDCWTNEVTKVTLDSLNEYSVVIPPDKEPGGGVRVLILDKQQPA